MHCFTPYRVSKITVACWLAAGALALVASSAHATYTVIEDDLLPDPAIAARNAPAPTQPDRFSIGFPKLQTNLGPLGMAALDTLVPNMRGASIRIVGRPDAMPYVGNEKQAFLARYRAINIKNYLVKKGVPEGSITLEVDNSPNPQPNGSTYPSDIYLTKGEARPVSGAAAVYTESRYPVEAQQGRASAPVYTSNRPGASLPPALAPQAAYVQPAYQAPAAVASESDQVIQYINQAVQSGKMHPTVALQLIRQLMANDGGRATPMQATAPIAAMPQYAPQPAPVQVAPKPVWSLNKNVGVRENIDAWSRIAGWNPSDWRATNNYRISRDSPDTVQGEFPEVLRMFGENSGLNVCPRMRGRYVQVTDANVPCKND